MGIFQAMKDSWREVSEQSAAENRQKNYVIPGSLIRMENNDVYVYAIYAGNGEVIQFVDGRVRHQTISSMKGRKWGFFDVMGFPDRLDIRPSSESLERALSSVGMTGKELVDKNRELFPFWCQVGEAATFANLMIKEAYAEKIQNSDFNKEDWEREKRAILEKAVEFWEREKSENLEKFVTEMEKQSTINELVDLFGLEVSRNIDMEYLNDG